MFVEGVCFMRARLRARIIEGTDVWYLRHFKNKKYHFKKINNDDMCIDDAYRKPQEAFNNLYNIGKVLWDADMCSKFEIAAFDENGQLFWKHRPDQYNFERNKYFNCFDEIIKEEYKSFSSPDFQNDKLEMDYLQDYQKRFWDRHVLNDIGVFEQMIRDTQLYEDMKVSKAWLETAPQDDKPSSIGFEHNGTWITNPFYDETLRFKVEPFSYYGMNNVLDFVCQLRNAIENKERSYVSSPSSLEEKIAVAKAVPGKKLNADKQSAQRDDEERL